MIIELDSVRIIYTDLNFISSGIGCIDNANVSGSPLHRLVKRDPQFAMGNDLRSGCRIQSVIRNHRAILGRIRCFYGKSGGGKQLQNQHEDEHHRKGPKAPHAKPSRKWTLWYYIFRPERMAFLGAQDSSLWRRTGKIKNRSVDRLKLVGVQASSLVDPGAQPSCCLQENLLHFFANLLVPVAVAGISPANFGILSVASAFLAKWTGEFPARNRETANFFKNCGRISRWCSTSSPALQPARLIQPVNPPV